MIRYFWKDGTPAVTAATGTPEWSTQMRALEEKHLDMEHKRIARTDVPGGYVSTVWLGLDHNHWGGPPLIFESMLFAPDSPDDDDCARYATEEEAREGHEEMVAKHSTNH